MKLDVVKTITLVPAQEAITIQVDTINTTWKDDGKSVSSELKLTNSNENGASSFGRQMSIVLWDATTTPTYEAVGDWTEAQAEARVKQLLNI